MTRKRRFFSGSSLEAALVAAGNEYGLAPERVQYRTIDKKHGYLKIRRNVVIEVDPENPEKPTETKADKKAPAPSTPPAEAQSGAPETQEEAPQAGEEEAPQAGEEETPEAGEEETPQAGEAEAEGQDEAVEADSEREDDEVAEEVGGDEDEAEKETPEPPDLEFADEEDERAYRAVMRGEELPPLRSRKRGEGGGQGKGGGKGGGKGKAGGQGKAGGKGRGRGREEKRGRSGGRSDDRGREKRDDRRSRKDSDRRPEKSGKPRQERKRAETESRSIARREPKDLKPIEKRLEKAGGEKADAAREATEWLLDLVDLDVDCEVYEGGERFEVELRGRDRKFLVADSGKVLTALEHLIPRVMRGICGEGYPIRTDSENFQEMREERLRDEALETAARVRRDGEPAILDAMDPADRRIVHITLTDDPEVTTRSLGDGYFKRVKVLPK